MKAEITKIEDVAAFIRLLIDEGTTVHPDDDFNFYVNVATGEPVYTANEAALRNYLMEQAFQVCEDSGLDIYNVTQEIYLKETGLDQYIPLP